MPDASEHLMDRPQLHPFGYRIVISVLEHGDKLYLPDNARPHEGIVLDGGTESELDVGAKVYFFGETMKIGDSYVIRMDQIVAWEAA